MEDMLLFYIKTYANDDVSCTVEKYVAHIILNDFYNSCYSDRHGPGRQSPSPMSNVHSREILCPVVMQESRGLESNLRDTLPFPLTFHRALLRRMRQDLDIELL